MIPLFIDNFYDNASQFNWEQTADGVIENLQAEIEQTKQKDILELVNKAAKGAINIIKNV